MFRRALPLLCLALLACGDDSDTLVPEEESLSIFTSTLDGWAPADLGLAAGSSFGVTATQFGAQFDFDVPEAGGEGVLTREYILTPGESYIVAVDMTVESSDGTVDIEPWTVVVGTSVEGAAFDFTEAFSTQTTTGANPQVLPIYGDVAVTAGASDGAGDTESEIRVALGFRPESSDARTYRIRQARILFIPAEGQE